MDVMVSLRRYLLGIGIAIVAVVVLVIVYFAFIEPLSLYGKVGNHKITKAEVSKLAKESEPYTYKQVGDSIMDRVLYQVIAKDLGISVTDRDVENELASRTGQHHPNSEAYLRIAIEADLLKQRIQKSTTTYYKGQYVIAHFDQHMVGKSSASLDNPVAGRAARIASDRAYADAYIKSVVANLKAGKTFQTEVDRELADGRIGQAAMPTSIHSGSFDTSNETATNTNLFSSDLVQQHYIKLNLGSFSEPFVVSSNPDDGEKSEEIFWLIVKLDEHNVAASSFDQVVEKKKTEIGYWRNEK